MHARFKCAAMATNATRKLLSKNARRTSRTKPHPNRTHSFVRNKHSINFATLDIGAIVRVSSALFPRIQLAPGAVHARCSFSNTFTLFTVVGLYNTIATCCRHRRTFHCTINQGTF
jgi:LSD1 subclass zinc finger protein